MRWRILCEVERITWGLIANVVFQLFKGNTYLSEVVLYPSTSNIYTDELRGYPSKMECLRASGHFIRASGIAIRASRCSIHACCPFICIWDGINQPLHESCICAKLASVQKVVSALKAYPSAPKQCSFPHKNPPTPNHSSHKKPSEIKKSE